VTWFQISALTRRALRLCGEWVCKGDINREAQRTLSLRREKFQLKPYPIKALPDCAPFTATDFLEPSNLFVRFLLRSLVTDHWSLISGARIKITFKLKRFAALSRSSTK
jgi:hypothetical protein